MINMDLRERVALRLDDIPWSPSPSPGVERRRLEREEAERGHTTSVVRYAPGSAFRQHTHTGGEEFLVLEGEFVDDTGRYPAGTYVRNPIGSKHAPSSPPGCVLFVKLCQMHADERAQTVRRDNDDGLWRPAGEHETRPLYADAREQVSLLRAPTGGALALAGAELLVLAGTVETAGARYPALSWLRLPTPETITLSPGARLWIKRGHLPAAE